MEKKITIRNAVPYDLKNIVELDATVWEDPSVPDGAHVWRLWIDYAIVFVAVSEEELIGSTFVFPSLTLYGNNTYLLHKMFVRKDRRGEGIGKCLLFDVQKQLKTIVGHKRAELLLTANPWNTTAKNLYAKFGFKEMCLKPDYYGPGKDRILMILTF